MTSRHRFTITRDGWRLGGACIRTVAWSPIALLITAAAWSPIGSAQTASYPSKPVRVLLGFPAGGGSDVQTRAIASRMTPHLGQPVVVENRPGAAGSIAAEAAARSVPDGYTAYVATPANYVGTGAVLNGNFKLNYDLFKDFAPVVMLARNQTILVANASLPVGSLRELIALAKTRPGALNFGSAGTGSLYHVSGELLQQMARISMTHVPYRGGAPLVNDLLGGQVQLAFADVSMVGPSIRAGKLKAIAIGAQRRFDGLPAVPTFEESGLPGYEASAFLALLVPTGTPSEVIARLRAAAVSALAEPELRAQFAGWGVSAASDVDLPAFLRSETRKWAEVLRVGRVALAE